MNNNLFYFLVVVVTICKGEKRICLEERDRDRETDGEKERDVLLGARPDWVCRGGRRLGVAPARDARGGKPRGVWIARRRHSFGRGGKRRFQTVGTLYYYVGRDILFCVSSFEDDDVLCSLSSRLVEYHHHHLCVCVSARGSVVRCDSKARRRQTDRARATLFFWPFALIFFFFC